MTDPKCHLLELPAELRDQIWELSFTPDHGEDEEVDLLAARPHSNALLQTCRQIYSEAHPLYLKGYRRFWSESHLFVDVHKDGICTKEDFRAIFSSFRKQDVDMISSLRVCVKYKTGRRCQLETLPGTNVWLGTEEFPGIWLRCYYAVLDTEDNYEWCEVSGKEEAIEKAATQDGLSTRLSMWEQIHTV